MEFITAPYKLFDYRRGASFTSLFRVYERENWGSLLSEQHRGNCLLVHFQRSQTIMGKSSRIDGSHGLCNNLGLMQSVR